MRKRRIINNITLRLLNGPNRLDFQSKRPNQKNGISSSLP